MIKHFVIRDFRGTCSSVEMLKGYMLIWRNAKGVHGKQKVGNPWARPSSQVVMETASQRFSTRAGFKPLTYFIKIKIFKSKGQKFSAFFKFTKWPQTKFHTHTMRESQVIRSIKAKIYHWVNFSWRTVFSLSIFYWNYTNRQWHAFV